MSLTKIGSIGINTGIQFAGVTTVSTLHVGSGVTLSSDGDGFFTGIITATFAGDGTSLTGVASTDNIRTNTNATFLQNINVSGTVTATSYAGSGANLTNLPAANLTGTLPAISGANLTGIEVGIATTSSQVSGITTVIDLSKDDIRLDCTGLVTVDARGGTEGGSHSLRIVNSGIATVSFNSYFKFPSGGAPNLPTASGSISLISFTVHTQGRVGVASVFLAGSSVNFS